MIKSPRALAISSAILLSTVITNIDMSQAQIPMPVYVAPSPIVMVQRPLLHHRTQYVSAVPVTVNHAAFYAPQVPVVPMAYGPVPTMSAYYVPTVHVVQTYCAPVVTTRKIWRRRVAVAPAVIHPVYWLPY